MQANILFGYKAITISTIVDKRNVITYCVMAIKP